MVIFCRSARVGSAASAAKLTISKSSSCNRVFSSPSKEVWLALIAKSDFCERPEAQVSRFARRSDATCKFAAIKPLEKACSSTCAWIATTASSCSICLKSPKIPFAGSSPDLFSVRVTIISSSSEGFDPLDSQLT